MNLCNCWWANDRFGRAVQTTKDLTFDSLTCRICLTLWIHIGFSHQAVMETLNETLHCRSGFSCGKCAAFVPRIWIYKSELQHQRENLVSGAENHASNIFIHSVTLLNRTLTLLMIWTNCLHTWIKKPYCILYQHWHIAHVFLNYMLFAVLPDALNHQSNSFILSVQCHHHSFTCKTIEVTLSCMYMAPYCTVMYSMLSIIYINGS